jgi:F-box-like
MITYFSGPGHISPHVTINALPDEVLLNIFFFCKVVALNSRLDFNMVYRWPGPWPHTWHELARVCRRWRYIVFSSPRRLDLRIHCTNHTSVKELLDIWPPFPIEVYPDRYNLGDDVIAALEHHDRVCHIQIGLPRSRHEFERFTTVMQKPFPALTYLNIRSESEWDPDPQAEGPPVDRDLLRQLPDTFLVGSAPHLKSLSFAGVPFPTLPQLLSSLSFDDLSGLWLESIPELGYISPDAMATGLSALTRLKSLCISFQEFHLDRITRHPRPFTRLILPSLTVFYFFGVNEYLEALLAQIDAPQLETFPITFFPEPILDIRELVYHSQTLWSFGCATVTIRDYEAEITLGLRDGTMKYPLELKIQGEAQRPDWHASSMAQVLIQSLSLLSGVTELAITIQSSFTRLEHLEVFMDNPEWLDLFRPFTAVHTLRLFGNQQLYLVSPLRWLTGERVTEVLPALQDIYFSKEVESEREDEYLQQCMELFIAARRHSGHPVRVQLPEFPSYSIQSPIPFLAGVRRLSYDSST